MRPRTLMICWLALTAVAGELCVFGARARAASACCSPACTCGCNEADGGPCRCGGFTWQANGDDQIDLLRADRQVGAYRPSADAYRPLVAGQWGTACAPPVAVPECHRRRPQPTTENYGVDRTAQAVAPHGWSINGRRVEPNEVLDSLAVAPAIPDDSGLPHVLWVGDDATGQRIAADVGDRARVHSVPPGHWMTLDRDGQPVYTRGLWFVRAADRQAVGHELAYAGPDQLAEGLRRCAPDWKPDAVPDLTPPAPPLLPALPWLANLPPVALPGALLAGGAVSLAGLVLSRRLRRSSP